jgi:hypothetical protein
VWGLLAYTAGMEECSECGGTAHLPEECPRATRYYADGNGACEWYYASRSEGRILAARYGWGTERYYREVILGTEVMHMVGACPLK